jgi:Ca2+-transporting ATPase
MDAVVAERQIDARWHCLTAEESLRRLGSSSDGLTSAEAGAALARYGPNAITGAEPFSPWALFLAQFKSVLIWVLIVAGVVSGALGDAQESIAILAIVVWNALGGFYQEYSAEKSIAALKRMTAPRTRVWRDGVVTTIPAVGVVPGDVIEFEAGDLIGADARLLAAASLTCSEAALTGEAEAVAKQTRPLRHSDLPVGDRTNMVFMGTSVAAGSGRGVVVATGMSTEIGGIAALIEEAGEDRETPLQQKLDRFGGTLLWAALGIVGLLFGLGLLRKEPAVDLFTTSVSLAIAALPESLPAIATAALSLGVMRMSRRRALVRRLASVETLGCTNVICTDKTGTLTMGSMSVRTLFADRRNFEVEGKGYQPDGEIRSDGVAIDAARDTVLQQMAEILVGCNNARLEGAGGSYSVVGDPTEAAMLCAGLRAGSDRDALERASPRLREIPFDSDRNLHSTLRRLSDGRVRVLTNGAPEGLLERCSRVLTHNGPRALTPCEREEFSLRNAALAIEGLRVLGCAFRDLDALPSQIDAEEIERDLVFVGLCSLRDPPRPEAREAIARCRTAGIRVVMITGDHPRTAIAIGRELGLDGIGATITGAELDALDDDALASRVPHTSIYARVNAAHKLRIVRAWKGEGAVVAMTGDGVNDAPAIKGADIGVAMGLTGSEVTKQASDMVIADDNFATIVEAVEEGRGILENIKNMLHYLLSCNASELLLLTVCIICGLPLPLLPIHLLWINLVTDGGPALCLAADRAERGFMNRPPRPRDEALMNKGFLETILLAAALIAAVSFLAFLYGLQTGGLAVGRSYAVTSMVFSQLLVALGARSGVTSLWRRNPLTNPYLLIIVGGLILVQMASHRILPFAHLLETTELSLREEIYLLAASAAPLLVLELVKEAQRRVAPLGPGPITIAGPWKNWITAGVLAAAAVGASLQWPGRQGAPTHYVTGLVERGSTSRLIAGSGATLDRARTAILAPVSGAVRFHDCEIGSKVVENQHCATIEQGPYRAAVARAREAAAKARKGERESQIRLERMRAALERARASGDHWKGLAASRAHEAALEAARRSAGLLERREEHLRKAELDLARTEVKIPIAGMVSERAAPGAAAKTDGPPLLVIVDDTPAQIEVDIAPDQIAAVEVGDRAFVKVATETLAARVTTVRKTENRVVIVAKAPEPRLAPGAAVPVQIEAGRHDNVLLAPNAAVRYALGKCDAPTLGDCAARLWALRDGKAVAAPVTLGGSDGERTEIVSGDLKAGDALILSQRE